MNCRNIQLLLPDFADDRLDAAAAWQVQTHLSACAECGRLHKGQAAVTALLQALPAQGPSAGFDAALAQRLALTRRPAAPPPPSWRTRLTPTFTLRRARPALALGAAAAAGIAAFVLPLHPVKPTANTSVTRTADPAFVADCLAQHRRDAAAEPLADLSAQTLTGSLDNAAAPEGAEAPAGEQGLL